MASLAMKCSLVVLGAPAQASLRGTSVSLRSSAVAAPQALPQLAVRAQAAEVAVAADVAPPADAAPAAGIDGLALQSSADRKQEVKDLKRRKRLLQKRELRKKGRWPPSKMKKLQNV